MKNLEETSRFYKALGDPIRLQIIDHLMKKELCICELTKLLKRDQSVIFRHVQILKEAGILKTNKEAKFLICCIKCKEKVKRVLNG